LIPAQEVWPQGGGTQGTPDEALSAAIGHLVSGCVWRRLPLCFRIPKPTAHRRFPTWCRAGVRGCLHDAVLHRLDDVGFGDVTRVSAPPSRHFST